MFFKSKKDKAPEADKAAAPAAAPSPQPAAKPNGAAAQAAPVAPAASPAPAAAPPASPPPAAPPAAPVAATAPPPVAAAAAPQTASRALSADDLKRQADYSHKIMQTFGSIMAIYLRSAVHRDMKISDIETFVGPALTTGQFSLAEATHNQNGLVTPVAVAMWASVSPAIDARLTAEPEKPPALSPADWKSGETIWLIEAVGEQKMIGPMLQRLQETAWKGRTVKMRARGEGGRVVTHVLMQQAVK